MPGDAFSTPYFAFYIYIIAILVAWLLITFIHPIRACINNLSANRNASIDGLRGFLAIGIFIHPSVFTWGIINNKHWSDIPSYFYTQFWQTGVAPFL
jgi:hypothetical protein